MSYRDSHVNFEECLRRGEAQALADRTSSLAPVNELGGALAEMARAVRLTRLSWRWWRDASDDAYGLEGNQYGPFPPGTDCKITFGRDGDIGTIRYVGPNSWSCAGDATVSDAMVRCAWIFRDMRSDPLQSKWTMSPFCTSSNLTRQSIRAS